MAELSIFIDESGDFGDYEKHAPFYIITLVFHDQSKEINNQINHLRRHVCEAGFPENHAIHSAPLIRRERDYRDLDMTQRRKLFRHLFNFMRLCDIKYKSFVFKKREFQDHDQLVSRMSREIGGRRDFYISCYFRALQNVLPLQAREYQFITFAHKPSTRT